MKIGLGISLTLHAAAFYMMADLGADVSSADASVEVDSLDIDIMTEAEFVSWTSPVPVSHSSPTVPVDLNDVQLDPETTYAPQDDETEFEVPMLAAVDLDLPDLPDFNASIPGISTTLQNVELERNQVETDELQLGIETGVAEDINLQTTLALDMGRNLQLPEAPRVDLTIAPIIRPEVMKDDVLREATRSDAGAETESVDQVEMSTAPDQSTLKIVTEAERSEDATTPLAIDDPYSDPTKLIARGVPVSRPAGISAPVAAEPDNDTIKAAIIGDVIRQQVTGQPPPVVNTASLMLTIDESRSIERLIKREWNIGVLSSAAQRVIVVVRIHLDQQGNLIRTQLVESRGGRGDAVDKAYEVARRAISKGLKDGIGLPKEKYEQWKVIEITFDPKEMRLL